MGARISLPEGTKLNFRNHDKGKMTYVIRGEIGRGASCIVYDGYYINNSGTPKPVRIKECYPCKLKMTRDVSGCLSVDQSSESVFEEFKSEMRESFAISNELFEARGLTNSISNSLDLYEANHTLYIVSAYLEGSSISCEMFDSLKDAVSVVKSTANAVKKIHDKGYLYLDIKPENIYVLNGTTQIIQLYDFDSLLPVYQKKEFDHYKIRYTKGFAALEQRMGRPGGIGKYTDVYGIGALLYYLIFGRTPDASVCNADAGFIFTERECVSEEGTAREDTVRQVDSVSRYAGNTYSDKLYVKLTEFFHHTIVSYAPDRYQDMEEVIERLTEIESYADLELPFICNSHIPEHIDLIGRTDEEEYLNQWYSGRGGKCLFVTGMGGIGKSTLVRGWISRNIYKDSYSQQESGSVKNEIQFDTVLYLFYQDSIQRMIGDDRQFCINTLEKTKEESYSDYFRRKLICLRKITENSNALLVIDNFDGIVEKDFFELLDVNWKIIVIARNSPCISEFETLNVGAIQTREDLYRLFDKSLGRAVEEDEKIYLDEIIENVHGHTLILELIARQIAKSYLTVRKACELVRIHGFSHIAAEKINYIKDGQSYYGRLSNIITALFPAAQMSLKKKSFLKILSLFDMPGVDISTFEEMLSLGSKDDINELIEEGWTYIDDKAIFLHPVIRETICQWEWTEDYKNLAKYMLNYICGQIQPEGKKRVEKYLRVSENILDNIKREKALNSLGEYLELLYYTIINMPPDKEEYIAAHAEELFHNPDVINMEAIIKLYDYVVYIYCEKGELESALDKIREAGKIVMRQYNHYLRGLYHGMKGNYYDALLDGGYFVQNEEEKETLRLLLDTVDKSIRYMRKSKKPDSGQYQAEYILSKINILTRSYPKKKKKIRKLLDKAYLLIEKYSLSDSGIRMNFYMACAWYYTLVEPDWTLAGKYSLKAWKIAKKADLSDIQMIDSVIVPRANIYAEWNRNRMAAVILEGGIKICEREQHRNLLPYIRKKMELYEHLSDICH